MDARSCCLYLNFSRLSGCDGSEVYKNSEWVPSHVGLLGNEVADYLAKAATSNPMDPEDHMALTSTKIYSRAKELICRTWVVRPVHPCTFCQVWDFPVRRLLQPPAVLRLCTDLWNRGSGLVSLDKMRSPDNARLVAFSQRSHRPRLIEAGDFNDSVIMNNLIDYEDGQEESIFFESR
ncbi:RNase H domain-containing protein [Trichonephila clavipes]|nr:RNase H domain-containing protein [Trichonephila clavipes]